VQSGRIAGFKIVIYYLAFLEVIVCALLLFALCFHSFCRPNEIGAFEGMSLHLKTCPFQWICRFLLSESEPLPELHHSLKSVFKFWL
jgi:hypothetical protein